MTENNTDETRSPEEADEGRIQTREDTESAMGGIPPQPVQPVSLPKGLLAGIDHFLHHPEQITENIRQEFELPRLCRTFFLISLVMAAVYGAVMGGTNLFQGADMETEYKLLMILITAVKVPVLFLLTLVIVLPPVYVSNAFTGSKLSFYQILALLLTATAISVTVLASMATVAFFFALTSSSYNFIKLLHVLFFVYAGASGLVFFSRAMQEVSSGNGRRTSRGLFVIWLLIYMFVGTQLAWVLRPFVGWPGEDFELFRERSGNFYESVFKSAGYVLRAEEESPKEEGPGNAGRDRTLRR